MRLQFIHRALQKARTAGFSGLPDLAKTEHGETVLALDDGLYDAQEWSPGETLSPVASKGPMPNVVVALSSTRIAGLATAVARLHRARFSPEFARFASPLAARLAPLKEGSKTCRDALLEGVRLRAEDRERRLALRWLKSLPELIEATSAACATFAQEQAEGYTLCHGDLWPAHAYFDGDTFAGFTDFESLCFASPALDLAQLILHFGGWDTRGDVLRSYERVTPFSDKDLLMLPIEAGVDLASEGYWSLYALYGDASSRTIEVQRAAHPINLGELAGSLQKVATAVESFGR